MVYYSSFFAKIIMMGGILMNIQRAKELSESSEEANVSFQGMPVMIQHVDESNETARIYEVTNPKRELTVPVNSLEEI